MSDAAHSGVGQVAGSRRQQRVVDVLALLLVLLAAVAGAAAPAPPLPAACQQQQQLDLQALLNGSNAEPLVASLVQAADACDGPSWKAPTTAACQDCKCQMTEVARQVEQRLAAMTKSAPAPPPSSLAPTLSSSSSCTTGTIAQLLSSLPAAVNVSWTSGCAWQTLPPCGLRGSRDASAVMETSGHAGGSSVALEQTASLLTDSLQWSAFCACGGAAKTGEDADTHAMCSEAKEAGLEGEGTGEQPGGLRVWPTRCHAKCMGANMSALQPCGSLLVPGLLPFGAAGPLAASGAGASEGDGDQQVEYHYHDDSDGGAVSSSSTTTISRASIQAAVAAASHGQRDVGTPTTTTPAAPAAAPEEHGNSTAPAMERRKRPKPPAQPCAWTAQQLYDALGGESLPALLADAGTCQAAACLLLGRLNVSSLDAGWRSCVPQLASTLLQALGSAAADVLRTLQACAADLACTASSSFSSSALSLAPAASMLGLGLPLPTPLVNRSSTNSTASGGAALQAALAQQQSADTPLARLADRLAVLRTNVNTNTNTTSTTTSGGGGSTGSALLAGLQQWRAGRKERQPVAGPAASPGGNSGAVWQLVGAGSSGGGGGGGYSSSMAPALGLGAGSGAADGQGGKAATWPAFCVCGREYSPVCRGSDLRWFPSTCFAKCQGVEESELGPCQDAVGAPGSAGGSSDNSDPQAGADDPAVAYYYY